MNHLESLLAEWYEIQGYLVTRNIKIDKRDKGGYNSEIDVLAFHPKKNEWIQIETSMDTYSWPKRIERIEKKFKHARDFVAKEYGEKAAIGLKQEFVLVYGNADDKKLKRGSIILAKYKIQEILKFIETEHSEIDRELISENYPLLRTLQFANHYYPNIL
ncbi:MAG: hypothetical protein JST76_09880 [Bacteroidetes bacterium]|nr:hypothetical protein [Bacteroidota bacterium]